MVSDKDVESILQQHGREWAEAARREETDNHREPGALMVTLRGEGEAVTPEFHGYATAQDLRQMGYPARYAEAIARRTEGGAHVLVSGHWIEKLFEVSVKTGAYIAVGEEE